MSRRIFALFLSISLVFVLALPALAQDAPPVPENAILAGLNFPRGVAYDADGNLYVAEAGVGGTELLAESPDPDFPDLTGGLTGQVSLLSADGTQSVHLAHPDVDRCIRL